MDGPLAGNADTTRFRYNQGRELIGTVGPDPDGGGALQHRATRNIIDARGLVTRMDAGTVADQSDGSFSNMAVHQSAEQDYDQHVRPTVQRLTSGGTTYALTQTSYDVLGRPECQAVRMDPAAFGSPPPSACDMGAGGTFGPDRISRTVYDALGRPSQLQVALGTDAAAVAASATYTQHGQIETLTDGENNRTTYVYDGHDRLFQTRFPVATVGANQSSTTDYEQLGYDAAGNVTSRRVRDGQVIGYSYDALGRMTAMDRPNVAGNEFDHSFGHDLLGRITSASDTAGHQIALGYDALGRPVSQASSWYGTTTAEYDVAGRRTRLVYPLGAGAFRFDHLVTGELAAVRTDGQQALATFGYDQAGRRASLARSNGDVTGYSYDAAGRLSSMSHDLGGTANDLTLGYSYNPAGQIVETTRSNDAYAYTGNSNQNRSDSVNGLNQVTNSGGTNVTHDARGNTTQIGGSATYSYTADNRMASVAGQNFYHDPLGRLVYSGAANSDFLYDLGSDQIILDRTGFGGSVNRAYIPGQGADELLIAYNPSNGSVEHLHADERGSILATTDGSGNAIAINRYDEYGAPQSGNSGRFQYTGQPWMPELGMYYYGARMYNPSGPGGGRFMQTDPIGYGDGMNGYAYVGGDPVNRVDPTGTETQCYGSSGGGYTTYSRDADGHETVGVVANRLEKCVGSRPTQFYGGDHAGGAGGGGGMETVTPLPPDPCNARLPDGSTVNRNVDYIRDVIRRVEGSRHAGDPRGLGALFAIGVWVGLVQEGGRWDYKLQPGGSEAIGNFNYGATGIVLFPLDVLLRGAGAVQTDPRNEFPGGPLDLGRSTYGDQPSDVPFIQQGASQCRGTRP